MNVLKVGAQNTDMKAQYFLLFFLVFIVSHAETPEILAGFGTDIRVELEEQPVADWQCLSRVLRSSVLHDHCFLNLLLLLLLFPSFLSIFLLAISLPIRLHFSATGIYTRIHAQCACIRIHVPAESSCVLITCLGTPPLRRQN